ncbi:DnaJ domain-containing protein [Helicobacter pylori]|nr:DnaJ domain-containing protein [Helicobacter pylori]
MIIGYYHLSGFFVWVVYALCKAYRKLASEYHPDKIQSKDLPEAFIIFATEKLKEISHAHEMIVKSRKEEKI